MLRLELVLVPVLVPGLEPVPAMLELEPVLAILELIFKPVLVLVTVLELTLVLQLKPVLEVKLVLELELEPLLLMTESILAALTSSFLRTTAVTIS